MRAQRSNESPSGAFKRPNGLAQQDGGALPRQVLRLPGRMRPPRLCCGIKHTKSENLPPYAPQIGSFTCYRCFLRAHICPSGADAGRQHALRGGREGKMRPKRAHTIQPCALKNQHRKVLLCGLGRVGREIFTFRVFYAAAKAGWTHTPRKPRYFPSMCLEKVRPYFPAFFSRNWLNFFCGTGDSRLSSHHLV